MTKEEMIFRKRCTPIVEKWMRDKGLDPSAKVAVINQIISKTQKQEPMKDLTKILKDGDEVYYIVTGKAHQIRLDKDDDTYPIMLLNTFVDGSLTKHGGVTPDGECLIFPSKEERNWDSFKRKEEFKKGDLCAFWDGGGYNKKIGLFFKYNTNDNKPYCSSMIKGGSFGQESSWQHCEKINIEDYI